MLRQSVREIGALLCIVGVGACGSARPSDGPVPQSGAPDAGELPPADPSAGFPLPAEARLFTETQSSVSYLTSLAAREVLAFYAEALRGRYSFESIPNGLALKGDAAPFVYITVAAYGAGVLLTLTRNALVDTSTARVPARVFGAPFPPNTTLMSRTANVLVAHARPSVPEICDWFGHQFASGVSRVGDTGTSAPQPYCMFSREGPQLRGEWTTVSVLLDRSSGLTLVSVIGNP